MIRQGAAAAILAFLSVGIHAWGMVLVFDWLDRYWESGKSDAVHSTGWLFRMFWALLALHLTQMAIWAWFYSAMGCFNDFDTALYFSISAYTTVGHGDVVLPPPWRLCGSIETCTGLLMFGWSTGFYWAFVSRALSQRHRARYSQT
jgi:hypothetical protein